MKVLNTFQKDGFVINHIKYNSPTFGGFYAVEITVDDIIVYEKDGLILDASLEVYLKKCNELKSK
jgi:hypothetical protein